MVGILYSWPVQVFEVASSESSNDQVGTEEVAQATQWQTALDLARQAGFRSLGESAEAYFEFKPGR